MRVHGKEHIGAVLSRFTKLLERSGMKHELRAYEHFEKPSEARHRKHANRKKAIRNALIAPRI